MRTRYRALLLAIAATLCAAGAAHAAPPKVTLCHAAGLDGTTQYVTLTVGYAAAYGPAGHFYENGTPRAGHEQDYLGECIVVTPTPTVTPDPSPTDEPSPTVDPTPTDDPTPTATATPTTKHWEPSWTPSGHVPPPGAASRKTLAQTDGMPVKTAGAIGVGLLLVGLASRWIANRKVSL